jgi:hypothetical protein
MWYWLRNTFVFVLTLLSMVIVDPVGIRGSWTSVHLTLPLLEIHRPRPFFSLVHSILPTALAIEKARAMGFM